MFQKVKVASPGLCSTPHCVHGEVTGDPSRGRWAAKEILAKICKG